MTATFFCLRAGVSPIPKTGVGLTPATDTARDCSAALYRSKRLPSLHEAGKHLAGEAQHWRVVVGDARDVDDHILDAHVDQALDAFVDLVHPADQELAAKLLEAPPLTT